MKKTKFPPSLFFLSLFLFSLQANAQLPDWYLENRLHAHTSLSFLSKGADPTSPANLLCPFVESTYLDDCFYTVYDDYMAPMGINVSTRFIKSNAILDTTSTNIRYSGATWCSEVPPIMNFSAGTFVDIPVLESCVCGTEPLDLPQIMIDKANSVGVEQILYYRHQTDRYWSDLFPDWTCKAIEGNGHHYADGDTTGTSGPMICVNSPMRDILKVRMKELVERGAAGIYFDGFHNLNVVGNIRDAVTDEIIYKRSRGCWCKYCEEKYPAFSGEPLPTINDNSYDPKMMDFYNYSIIKHFTEIQDAMHAADPSSVAIISTSRFASLTYDGIDDSFVRIIDVPKTEYTIPLRFGGNREFYDTNGVLKDYEIPFKIRLGGGWTRLRDLSKNRTMHSWIFNKVDTNGDQVYNFNHDQLQLLLGSAYTHGFVLNPFLNAKDYAGDINIVKPAFDLDEKIGGYLKNMVPIKWNAVLYDNDITKKYLDIIDESNLGQSFEDQENNLWKKFLLPYHASYEVFKNYRYYVNSVDAMRSVKSPVYVLDKEDFLNNQGLDRIKNIVVPNHTELDANTMNQLASFGGTVVNVDPANNESLYLKSNSDIDHYNLLKPIYNAAIADNPPFIYVRSNYDSTSDIANEVTAEFYESDGTTTVPYDYVVTLTNDFSWAIPKITWDGGYQTHGHGYLTDPETIPPPPGVNGGKLSIYLTVPGCVDVENVKAFRLNPAGLGNPVTQGVVKLSDGSFRVSVSGFDLNAVIGIELLGDCADPDQYSLVENQSNNSFNSMSTSVSNSNTDNDEWKILKNPSDDYLILENSDLEDYSTYQLEVYDSNSSLVFKQENIIESFIEVDMNSLPDGIYFVRMKNEKNELMFGDRIVKLSNK